MSYLAQPRLYFAGRFQADPSTVNNDPTHFNNATFQPNFQQPGPGATNGWWNPRGTGGWRFYGCTVTAVDFESGIADPVVGAAVSDADDRVSAKIVDLDPLQQGVSEIWGFQVRLVGSDNKELLRGDYRVAAFSDMWGRGAGSSAGDTSAGAFWQSVLENVVWGDVSCSPFLTALRAATQQDRLSIKFNVDGYNMSSNDPKFTTGRVVGAIGPYFEGEPAWFTVGRHLVPSAPIVNYMTCIVDSLRGKVVADFGNALQTTVPGGPINPMGTLSLAIGTSTPTPLGDLTYTDPDWYSKRAGIQEFPVGPAELAALETNALVLLQSQAGGPPNLLLTENPGGWYVRADCFVFRLNPGDSADVELRASQYGKPLAGAEILLGFTNGQIDNSSFLINAPAAALQFPATVTTDAHGRAVFRLAASNPGSPRNYLDGQVYGVGYGLKAANVGLLTPNPSDFVSVLVWTETDFPPQPTWWQHVEPVLQQYQNLYPRMGNIVHLGEYASVVANLPALQAVFTMDRHNPNYMPATRDLSGSKLAMILAWMNTKGPDGKPLLGVQPANS